MSTLRDVPQKNIDDETLPGAVGLLAHGDQVEVEAAESVDTEGSAPMMPDSIFRIASITKPIVAAGLLTLIEDGHRNWRARQWSAPRRAPSTTWSRAANHRGGPGFPRTFRCRRSTSCSRCSRTAATKHLPAPG